MNERLTALRNHLFEQLYVKTRLAPEEIADLFSVEPDYVRMVLSSRSVRFVWATHLPPAPSPAVRGFPPPETVTEGLPAWGDRERRFCDQCDKLRYWAEANACASRFCVFWREVRAAA